METSAQLANWQLLTIVGLPTLVSLLGFVSNNLRISDLAANMNARFQSIESRLEILTGKVAELTDRVIRIEAKLHIE